MFYVSRILVAFYNLRINLANPDISRKFCTASQISQKIRLGGLQSGDSYTGTLRQHQQPIPRQQLPVCQ